MYQISMRQYKTWIFICVKKERTAVFPAKKSIVRKTNLFQAEQNRDKIDFCFGAKLKQMDIFHRFIYPG